ncbi:MAG: protein-glutamate O-methyltransferase CheR [Myxococcota bacterium]
MQGLERGEVAVDLEMSKSEFESLRGLIYERIGVSVTPAKIPLLKARLRHLVHRLGAKSYGEYCERMQRQQNAEALSDLADAVTTNHTHFWREPAHFDMLERRVIPELVQASRRSGSKSLRVWCAAASTGQEPFTLATILQMALGSEYAQWDSGVLATDISGRVLDLAQQGRYPAEDVRPLPAPVLKTMMQEKGPGVFEVRPAIAKEVTFRRLNLVGGPFRFKRPFEVVFCRNVMIYFDEPTRMDVARRIAEVLRPGGYLFVGMAESLGTRPPGLETVAPAVYRRTEERL